MTHNYGTLETIVSLSLGSRGITHSKKYVPFKTSKRSLGVLKLCLFIHFFKDIILKLSAGIKKQIGIQEQNALTFILEKFEVAENVINYQVKMNKQANNTEISQSNDVYFFYITNSPKCCIDFAII